MGVIGGVDSDELSDLAQRAGAIIEVPAPRLAGGKPPTTGPPDLTQPQQTIHLRSTSLV
jgi:hypothetical protein